jgi:signal transduction histidine kinase
MGNIEFPKNSMDYLRLKNLSIRKRLPLLICILLLGSIIAFSWISYYGIKKASFQVGKERLYTVSDQLTTMLGQSALSLVTTTKTAAGQEIIKKYLAGDPSVSDSSVLQVLQKLRPDSLSVLVELLNADKKSVLQSRRPGSTINLNTADVITAAKPGPDFAKVGKLYLAGDSIYYPVIASITEKDHVTGYLVKWRLQKATARSIAQLSQLLGGNATLYIGNSDGDFWTDLNKQVPAPPMKKMHAEKQGRSYLEYSSAKGDPVIATALPIANTEWQVLVEVSKKSILEASNRFLRWLLVIGLLFIVIGIVISWFVSRSITGPLKKLTAASAAIAAGDGSITVPVDRNDELGQLALAFNTMAVHVDTARQTLEKKVQERTVQLEKANKELEAFSYSVSHDLRAPLRAISGYAVILKEDYASRLDNEAHRIADKIINNAGMMGRLIDDLISFSQMGRKETHYRPVDMKKMADTCMAELLQLEPADKYQVAIDSIPPCYGDESLIRQVWINLISNALKYSSKTENPRIEIGCREGDLMNTYYVKDNGAGFDMQYAHKLFGVFQRLHSQKEFEGTGVGLALTKRIIDKHKGEIYAESSTGAGATFYFSLPVVNQT